MQMPNWKCSTIQRFEAVKGSSECFIAHRTSGWDVRDDEGELYEGVETDLDAREEGWRGGNGGGEEGDDVEAE